MKKNILLQRGIKIVCLILVVLLLTDVGMLLVANYDYNQIILEGFYLEPKGSLDVVLLGASEVRAGFSSAYAYERFGFTSYPYVVDGNSVLMLQSQVREILKTQNPQCIVVEINGFLPGNASSHTEEGRLRRYLDNAPFSMNRLNTIMQTIPKEDRLNYIFPISKYHSNWKSIGEQSDEILDLLAIKQRGFSLLKGTVTNIAKADISNMIDISGDYATAPMEEQAYGLLISFLEFCKENQLKNVVFTRFPHIIRTEGQYNKFKRCNEAERIIAEYGFDVYNFERDYKMVDIDFSEDFYNDDHLYLTGQRKVTECVGRILVEEYGVMPHPQPEKNRRNWETSAKYYELLYEHCENLRNNGKKGIFYETRELVEQLTALENEKS